MTFFFEEINLCYSTPSCGHPKTGLNRGINAATGTGGKAVSKTIYKICSSEEWQTACAEGCFTGAAIDVQDGYIHFSTASQVKETARLHFSGQKNLMLVGVDIKNLEPNLKWEASRGGDLFPHLFAALDVAVVKSVTALVVGEDGLHIFPQLEQ